MEKAQSTNFRNCISEECKNIIKAVNTKDNIRFTFNDVKILSKHISIFMKKFKQPNTVTVMLIESIRHVLTCIYFRKLKSAMYGECQSIKTV